MCHARKIGTKIEEKVVHSLLWAALLPSPSPLLPSLLSSHSKGCACGLVVINCAEHEYMNMAPLTYEAIDARGLIIEEAQYTKFISLNA